MDASALQQIFERLDDALTNPTELLIFGGAALLARGYEGRVTSDIDVLPTSSFRDADLRRACEAAGIDFHPPDKELAGRDYLEVVPEETLVLPRASPERPYNTLFRGQQLIVRAPPSADLIISKLKRIEPEDFADIQFLVRRFGVTEADVSEAFSRLPERYRDDPVVCDNLRYLSEDLWLAE